MNPITITPKELSLEPLGFLTRDEERRILVELLRTNDEFYVMARQIHLLNSVAVWGELLVKFPNTLGALTDWYINHQWEPAQQSMELAIRKHGG